MKVTGLVFLRKGGLLCATCEFAPEDHTTLASLTEDWRPHITLLYSSPWRPKHSNDMLKAMEEMVLQRAAKPSEARTDADVAEVGETQLDPVSQGDSMEVTEAAVYDHPNGSMQVLSGVSLCEEANQTLVVLQLTPPLDLGPCEFKFF